MKSKFFTLAIIVTLPVLFIRCDSNDKKVKEKETYVENLEDRSEPIPIEEIAGLWQGSQKDLFQNSTGVKLNINSDGTYNVNTFTNSEPDGTSEGTVKTIVNKKEVIKDAYSKKEIFEHLIEFHTPSGNIFVYGVMFKPRKEIWPKKDGFGADVLSFQIKKE